MVKCNGYFDRFRSVPIYTTFSTYATTYPSAYYDATDDEVYVHLNWDNSPLQVVVKLATTNTTNIELEQPQLAAYPNIISHFSTLEYAIKNSGNYRLELMDNSGRVVETFFEEYLTVGNYDFDWRLDKTHLASGVYYLRLVGDGGLAMSPVVLK